MIYILLDTQVFINSLIANNKFSYSLLQLESWCKEGNIQILYPDILQKEWEKHKNTVVDKIKKSEKNVQDLQQNYEFEITDDQLEKGQNKLYSQIELLAELISNYSSSFNSAAALYKLGYERKEKKQAPFHKKLDSLNDWLIYSSTIKYLEKNGINEFYFISGNVTDFSDRNKDELIHPELLEYSGNIEVKYFTRIQAFMEHLYSSGYSKLNEEQVNSSYNEPNSSKKKPKVVLKSEVQAINELEKLLNNALTNLDFIHYRHLNQFVFSHFSEETRFNHYILDTDSKYLSDALKSVQQKNGKLIFLEKLPFTPTEKHLAKLKLIFKRLRRNGVYYWEYDYNRTVIHAEKDDKCSCIRCKIEVFKFLEINPDWKSAKETEFEFYLKRGFSWLRLGNFPKAYYDTLKALKIAKKEKNEMLIYRANYNLSKLAIRLRNNLMIGDFYDQILEELESLGLGSLLHNNSSDLDNAVIRWMENENYIQEAYLEINQLKTKIIDANINSYRNGTSNNNFISQLAFKYSQISSFIQVNVFYFEDFTEWRDTTDSFIEATLASYSTNDGSSKLESLNDWILTEIIKFGKSERIDLLIRQYKLKDISYKPNYNKEYQITTLINNLLETNHIEFVSKHFEDNYSKQTFLDKQKKWVNNALLLLGLIDFDATFIQNAISKIIERINRIGIDFDIFRFQSLLIRRADLISLKQLSEITTIGFVSHNINPYFFFANLAEIAEEKKVKISLKKEDLLLLDNLISSLSPSNKRTLVQLARILKGKQKDYIRMCIMSTLKDEDYFSEIPLFLLAVLYDILDYDEDKMQVYIDYLTPKEQPQRIGRSLHNIEKYNYQLNELIDVIYKFDIEESKFTGLLKHSDYYQWLLQIDSFDYQKFNPEWITLHDGFNYNKRFKQSKILKETLKDYVAKTYSLVAERVKERYYEIYSN